MTRRKPVYVGLSTSAVLAGEEDLTLWSEEELIRGQRKNRHGKFTGSRPKVVARAIHDELVKRKLTKAYALLNESIYDAVAILIDIAKDERTDAAVRLKAVKEILDRTIGKQPIPIRMEIEPIAKAFNAMLVPDDHTPALSPPAGNAKNDEILDAELVDDD